MNKKLITIVGTVILILAMGTIAFAATPTSDDQNKVSTVQTQNQQNQFGYGAGMMSSRNSFMMDQNGNLVGEKDFTTKLDKAIQDGTITEKDKDFYQNMYKNCTNGNMMQSGSVRR